MDRSCCLPNVVRHFIGGTKPVTAWRSFSGCNILEFFNLVYTGEDTRLGTCRAGEPEPDPLEKKTEAGAGAAWKKKSGAGAKKISRLFSPRRR